MQYSPLYYSSSARSQAKAKMPRAPSLYSFHSKTGMSPYHRKRVDHSLVPMSMSNCCCQNVFTAVLIYGMVATLFMVAFVCFSASSNFQYQGEGDPFSDNNYYKRKVNGEIGLYQPGQGERRVHAEELRKRLTDLNNDYRDIKTLRLDSRRGGLNLKGYNSTLNGELQRRLEELHDDYREIPYLKKKYLSKCGTCSLVTSSGRLLYHQAGKEIDSADCVIRMNNAPVLGYEDFVGKRTTTRIVCFKSVGNLRKSMLAGKGQTDEVLVWGAEHPGHGRWAMTKLKMFSRQYPKTKWFSLRDVGEEKVNVIFESETGISRAETNTWLSTGLFTMLYALQTCEKVTVYGMVDENFCKTEEDQEVPYHYYEELPWKECEFLNMHENEKKQGHRYLTEKALFRRFASMFNLQFSHPSWNISKGHQEDLISPFREKYRKEHLKENLEHKSER